MSKQLKLRRGTTAQHSTFTGAEGEVTVDTTKDTLVVHDGTTAGGIPLATEASVASLTTAVGTKAADSAVVKLTGDQNVAGVKTFSGATTVVNGNLGVGTASPTARATLSGTGSGAAADLTNLTASTGRSWRVVSGDNGSMYVTDMTAGADRLSVDTSGNFKFNSGYGSVATAYGCRAWVTFNGNPSTINRSGNVSSVTRGSTGNYIVNFTNAMPDAYYSAVAAGDVGGWGTGSTQTGAFGPGGFGVNVRNTSMAQTDAAVGVAVFR